MSKTMNCALVPRMARRAPSLLKGLALAIGALASSWVLGAELSATSRKEVDHLLATVGSSGCEFYRAGSWHSARTAQAHLEHKYQYLATRQMLQSADDFIVKAATRSSMTGEAYAIRCTPNTAQPSSTWLESELRAHRNARPAAAQPRK